MKVDDSLSNVFGVAPTPPQSTEVITQDGEIITPPNEKIENDYDVARGNLRELLTTGKAALEHALEVAKSSEHPRAFEVVGNLMKQLADVNQQLMDIHQQKQKLDGPKETKKSGDRVTNNAIFVGSTNELSKMIKNMNRGE
jgi:hypothetical protein